VVEWLRPVLEFRDLAQQKPIKAIHTVDEQIKRSPELAILDIEQKFKAEREIAVAAASILARAAREHWIDRASRRLNLNLRKLTALNALSNENAERFAKISFLSIGKRK